MDTRNESDRIITCFIVAFLRTLVALGLLVGVIVMLVYDLTRGDDDGQGT